jgi:electron-transferring-flavoprotein dehydrogenase
MAASFLYHMEDNKVAMGFITGLNYSNPYLSPFEEFQRWKTHPNIRWYLTSTAKSTAKRLAYGARAIRWWAAMPAYLNVSRIKGSHAAIKTGMLAARPPTKRSSPAAAATNSAPTRKPSRKSWLYTELNKSRATSRAWFK